MCPLRYFVGAGAGTIELCLADTSLRAMKRGSGVSRERTLVVLTLAFCKRSELAKSQTAPLDLSVADPLRDDCGRTGDEFYRQNHALSLSPFDVFSSTWSAYRLSSDDL